MDTKKNEETYATTLAAQVFRAAMAISAVNEYKIRQYDIVAAYTNAEIPKSIIAYLPDGFQATGFFLLIKRALYGLPQSELLWQNHLQSTLIEIGLAPVPGVNCLFVNNYLITLFYVDDIIVIYHERDIAKANIFEEKLMSKYHVKPLGQIYHLMENIAKEFNIDMSILKAPTTPLPLSPLYPN